VPSLLALPAALGAYSLYLHHRRGDWLAFSHAERFWTRSTPHLGPLTGLKEALAQGLNSTDLVLRHLPRRLGGQAGFNADFQHAMWDSFHLLLFVAACLLTVVAWRKLGIAFGLYSAATLLIVLSEPADGFALESFPRFVMADFPLVLALASLTASRPGARTWTLVGLASSCAVAGVAFSRGTVWVA
jgi:hypothetical protein